MKKEEREDKSCLQMKAKIRMVVLAKYTTVTKDIKSAAVLVQKLEEKKKSLRCWKAKIGCYCISVDLLSLHQKNVIKMSMHPVSTTEE